MAHGRVWYYEVPSMYSTETNPTTILLPRQFLCPQKSSEATQSPQYLLHSYYIPKHA